MGKSDRRRAIGWCAMLVLAPLLACGGEDPAAPAGDADGDEAEPPSPANADHTLPEGTLDVAYTACRDCSPGVEPDYLLLFSEGISGTVTIADATERNATLRLLEMRGSGSRRDVLRLFGEPIVVLRRNEVDGAFAGTVAYGAAAEFVPIFRRSGDRIECDFVVLHLKHDVGTTTCTVGQ